MVIASLAGKVAAATWACFSTNPSRCCQQVPGRYIDPCEMPFSETTAMVPFFVQIKCKLGQSYVVANALAEAEIASEIYSTAGHYDLLVKFYVDKDTDIGHFVNEKVQIIPGIQDTHTIITFKAFGTG
jgi:DNA-binding Lrp family transcriptional regulator